MVLSHIDLLSGPCGSTDMDLAAMSLVGGYRESPDRDLEMVSFDVVDLS